MPMRSFLILTFLLLGSTASAATLTVAVDRQGFSGPIRVAVAPRVDGSPPEWSLAKTLPAGDPAAVTFDALAPGLYIVLASGPQPLQRLSAKANVDSDGTTLRLVVPRAKAELRATLAGAPLAGARITLTHRELRWNTDVETGADGRFAGEVWEAAVYTAGVRRNAASAPHTVDVWLSPKPVTIDVPDRHVVGRVLAEGKPLAGAIVDLRSENSESILTVRTRSGAEGQFEFFGAREGALTLTARAPSYLQGDAVAFELRGATGRHSVDVALTRGVPRAVRVMDARGAAMGGAMLIASCDGNVKSTSVTDGEGRAEVGLPDGDARCAIYALPEEGSIAIETVEGAQPLLIRVAEGTSSLRLALQSDAGEVFSAMSLLMRIDGVVVPPAVARLLASRFGLMTNEAGIVSLERIPPGLYEFWPYRSGSEGQMLYETAAEFDAPIAVKVLTGENNATVRFQAR